MLFGSQNHYQKRFYFIFSLLLGCSLLFNRVALSQEFIEGINIYNKSQFNYLVSHYGPDFLKGHSTEKGLANYFIAESNYNLALEQTEPNSAADYLRNAWSGFELAQSDQELKNTYPAFFSFAKYKKAWCSFRLAELGVEPQRKFEQAYHEFLNKTHDQMPDSLTAFALIMAAESKFLQSSAIFMEQLDRSVDPEQLNDVLNSYQQIEKLYNRLLNLLESTSFARSESLKEVVILKKNLLHFSFSKFYQVSAEGFENTLSLGEKNNYKNTALELLTEVNLDVFSEMSQPHFEYAAYFNLEKFLNNYLLTYNLKYKNNFLQTANSSFGETFRAEVFYKRANLYQANRDIKSNELTQLAAINYDSAKAIPESYYWNGLLEMTNGNYGKSKDSFLQFLRSPNSDMKFSRREEILVEDATYQKYFLDFEKFYLSNNMGKLKRLASFIEDFHPQNKIVKKRTEQLKLLANCSLSANRQQIWRNVLSGTEDEKLDQALATVRFVLPRAALNIGVVRHKYLKLLETLLKITDQKRGDETLFYKGIVKSLEAEIEPTLSDKINKFEEAASLLKSIRPGFENKIEAEYIRGRCLFFADNFEEAKAVLIPLINDQKSLRALFYVGEIFRLDGFGRPAKACYTAIITYAENEKHVFNDFWLSNAKAAFEASSDRGDLKILDSVLINPVLYQPEINPENLTYERLAEEKFLKKRLAREAVLWQIRYGLPVKNIYTSRHRLRKNLVAPGNYYGAMSGYLDEVRGQITTSLALRVILPPGTNSNVKVTLDGNILKKSDSLYIERKIPLHSDLELIIENPACYAFRTKYKFSKPGQDRKTVRLNKKLDFIFSKKGKNIFNDYGYPFSQRKDDNYTLNEISEIDVSADLIKDFNNLIELRDCTLDVTNQRFLTINSKENSIWEYSSKGERTGKLQLQAGINLNSPEGIAVVGNGEIFVTDWGNHRIVHLRSNGNLIGDIGTVKTTVTNRIGTEINLVYPTRIFVPSLHGRTNPTAHEFIQDYLYVADQNGIHVIKTDGTYLDTLVGVESKFKKGEFYGFFAEEFQNKSKLYVLQRLNSSPGKIFEFVSN